MGLTLYCPCLAGVIPSGMDGITFGPLSIIRASEKDDAGLKAHEETHQAQFDADPIGFPLRYITQPHYRLSAEAVAYAKQLATYPQSEWYGFRQQALGYLKDNSLYHLDGHATGADITAALDQAIAKLGVTI